MTLLVIYNPISGDSTAEQFFNAHVIPRLHAANRVPAEVVRTCAPGDAGTATLRFLSRHKGDITVVLGSGDGTLHEIVNHVAFATDARIRDDDQTPRAVHFVLVPCGTANALYASLFKPTLPQNEVAYKLRSLEAFLGAPASKDSKPLTLSLTSLFNPLGSHPDLSHPPVASIVVTSTALHASILKDSEKLRKEMPGIERFKVAAQQNITKWYTSHVKLLPIPSFGVVQIYDPHKSDFVPSGNCNESDSALGVHGPFAYFLSTVNVDRLEPQFRINPTMSSNPPAVASMDLILVRPQRDPTFTSDTFQAREKFVEKTMAVLTAAYQDGTHIGLRYSENGGLTESGDGNTVVECFRCGGWEWIPEETDQDAHLLCADGNIFEIDKGGRAVCKAASRTDTILRAFYVYV